MTETKRFHIGDVISAATGRLVSLDHIGGVYNVLGWMTGDELYTHALPRASRECEPLLRWQVRNWMRSQALHHPDGLLVVVDPK